MSFKLVARYSRLHMSEVDFPIHINGLYCPPSQRPYPCPETRQAINISNIIFDSISGTGSNSLVGAFECSKAEPCRDISLTNVTLIAA